MAEEAPVGTNAIPAGSRLYVLGVGEMHAVARYQRMRFWKSIVDIQYCVRLLVPWLADERGAFFVPVHLADAMLPIECVVREAR